MSNKNLFCYMIFAMQRFFCGNFFNIENFFLKELFKNKKDLPWEILQSIKFFLENFKFKKIKKIDGVFIENRKKVFLAKDVIIEKGAYIKGPCVIGENSVIRSGAYIRENVIIGKKTLIGHGTEIKNSLLLDEVKASHFSYIGDSIIGNKVNLGAKVVLANYRLDKKEIFVEKISTGTNKLGAIVSDNVQIGCGCILNPGTVIGKNTICFGSLNLKGIIEKDLVIKK